MVDRQLAGRGRKEQRLELVVRGDPLHLGTVVLASSEVRNHAELAEGPPRAVRDRLAGADPPRR